MKNLNLFNFFKSKKKAASDKNQPPFRSSELSASLESAHLQKKELIRAALKDTLRFHGLPAEWIRFEVLTLPHRNGTEETIIQLVIKNWSDSLLRYGFALERRLLARLDWYEPTVDHAHFTVTWRYDKNCMCPYLDMPRDDFWVVKADIPLGANSLDILDRRRNTRAPDAPLYIRDTEQHGGKDVLYAPTAMAPLS